MRRNLEWEIVEAEYPLFTPKLRAFLDELHTTLKGDPRADEHVVESVWRRFSDDLQEFDLDESTEDERLEAGGLTARGRAALRTYIDQAQKLAASLQNLDNEQFRARYANHSAQAEASHKANRLARGEREDRFAFFSLPNADVDVEAWQMKPVWTLEEATALSFGKEPSRVNVQALRDYTLRMNSPFCDRFLERLDVLKRAASAKQLSEPVLPAEFLKWAGQHGIKLPVGFVPSRRAVGASADDLNANTLHHYHRILMGIAIRRYGFDIGKDDSENQKGVYAALANDLKAANLPVDVKTLRKYLRGARAWIASSDLKPSKKPGKKAL